MSYMLHKKYKIQWTLYLMHIKPPTNVYVINQRCLKCLLTHPLPPLLWDSINADCQPLWPAMSRWHQDTGGGATRKHSEGETVLFIRTGKVDVSASFQGPFRKHFKGCRLWIQTASDVTNSVSSPLCKLIFHLPPLPNRFTRLNQMNKTMRPLCQCSEALSESCPKHADNLDFQPATAINLGNMSIMQ